MNANAALRVENLGKQYRIGSSIGATDLRETLTNVLTWPVRRLRSSGRNEASERRTSEVFWALRDVDFEVNHGEVVGIIGRNGAGKSTLLKVLSGITEPTEGRVELYGRVGSLLEVGTGFHPELTGRENIYLSGSILGMTRAEIDRKFEEIVAFSGVQKFLDTPVKRYSSGMYVRLGFAVAAHLDPEILLIDEVLAVGDIDFQKKCIGSMKSVARSGRTVVIISHNMALIESLCSRAIWVDEGRLKASGSPAAVIEQYLSASRRLVPKTLGSDRANRNATRAFFSDVEIVGEDGSTTHDVRMGAGLTIRLSITAAEAIEKPWIGIQIRTSYDQLIFHFANREAGYELEPLSGDIVVICRTEALNLLPDRYYVDLILADMSNTWYDEVASATHFDVQPADVFNSGMPMDKTYGLTYYPSHWTAFPSTTQRVRPL